MRCFDLFVIGDPCLDNWRLWIESVKAATVGAIAYCLFDNVKTELMKMVNVARAGLHGGVPATAAAEHYYYVCALEESCLVVTNGPGAAVGGNRTRWHEGVGYFREASRTAGWSRWTCRSNDCLATVRSIVWT